MCLCYKGSKGCPFNILFVGPVHVQHCRMFISKSTHQFHACLQPFATNAAAAGTRDTPYKGGGSWIHPFTSQQTRALLRHPPASQGTEPPPALSLRGYPIRVVCGRFRRGAMLRCGRKGGLELWLATNSPEHFVERVLQAATSAVRRRFGGGCGAVPVSRSRRGGGATRRKGAGVQKLGFAPGGWWMGLEEGQVAPVALQCPWEALGVPSSHFSRPASRSGGEQTSIMRGSGWLGRPWELSKDAEINEV